MAFSHGSKAKVYLDGYDLSSYTRNVTTSSSLDLQDASVLGNTFKTYVVGLNDATMTYEGLLDGAASASDEIWNNIQAASNSGTVSRTLYVPQGPGAQPSGTTATYCYGMEAWNTSVERSTGVDNVASWSAEMQSNIGIERLALYHPFGAEVAGGNTTSLDNTAVSTTAGGTAYLLVLSGASLVVKVQDSADNSAWADLASFTFTSASARTTQRISTTSGTIRRYTRVLWTGTGTFICAFGRK
jgi:hypothetical protein